MANDSPRPDSTWAPDALRADLAAALEAHQFFLVYQPTIDLQTNAFAGVEALIRWRHPDRGVLNPEVFITELETSGQITAVGRWALITACEQGAAWHDRGYRFSVSVNVSLEQLDRPGLSQDVTHALASSRFDPSLLVLEFPFAAISGEGAATATRLSDLATLGVRLAIDNFSPNDDSIVVLQRFPIDVVKLAREFIAELTEEPTSRSHVQQLVELAKSRGLRIIASGIEDVDQRRRLQVDEVAMGQGFLFSKPHEAEEIDRYLQDFSIFSGKPL